MDAIIEFFKSFTSESLAASVLVVVLVFNILLSTASQILEAVGKKLEEDHWLKKLLVISQKIIDSLQGNNKHNG